MNALIDEDGFLHKRKGYIINVQRKHSIEGQKSNIIELIVDSRWSYEIDKSNKDKYLEEIKEKFNATSGGFLFESFITGLLNGKVPDYNSKVDIVGHDGKTTYQVKLVDWMSDNGNIRLFRDPKTKYTLDHVVTWQNRNKKEIKDKKLFLTFI